MTSQHRTPAGTPTGGQFAASARAESDVTLTGAPPPTRADLLASPELRGLPAAWLSPKTDAELAETVAGMRASRAEFEAQQAAEAEAAAAETKRRRAYRRPAWLHMARDAAGTRRYSTEDGYTGAEIEEVADGRATTRYLVRSADGAGATVDRVEQMVTWIEDDRV